MLHAPWSEFKKGFLNGVTDVTDVTDDNPVAKYSRVHEFVNGLVSMVCQSFPDFLALISTDSELISNKDKQYYQACANVTLDRQVGSQYFISAANAFVLKRCSYRIHKIYW